MTRYRRRQRKGSPEAVAEWLRDNLRRQGHGNGARFRKRRWESYIMRALEVSTRQSVWSWNRALENYGMIRVLSKDVVLLDPWDHGAPIREEYDSAEEYEEAVEAHLAKGGRPDE